MDQLDKEMDMLPLSKLHRANICLWHTAPSWPREWTAFVIFILYVETGKGAKGMGEGSSQRTPGNSQEAGRRDRREPFPGGSVQT